MKLKRSIKALMPHLKPDRDGGLQHLLASRITRLGASTDRPEKFIGMHFMNPVPVMKLVEVIRGIATDEPTFHGHRRRWRRRLGKTTVGERRTSRPSSSTASWCR